MPCPKKTLLWASTHAFEGIRPLVRLLQGDICSKRTCYYIMISLKLSELLFNLLSTAGRSGENNLFISFAFSADFPKLRHGDMSSSVGRARTLRRDIFFLFV